MKFVLKWIKPFLAGYVSTLLFHQGLLAVFHSVGAVDRVPYSTVPVPPLGVPAVVSLAFWGGIWGALIWPLLARAQGVGYWLRALVIGAIGPSAVALLVVMPLKGAPIAGGGDPNLIMGALMLNGAWGFGVALLMSLAEPKASGEWH